MERDDFFDYLVVREGGWIESVVMFFWECLYCDGERCLDFVVEFVWEWIVFGMWGYWLFL